MFICHYYAFSYNKRQKFTLVVIIIAVIMVFIHVLVFKNLRIFIADSKSGSEGYRFSAPKSNNASVASFSASCHLS